jgi:predicted enzyme related to lactoylglutathione lyase
MDAQQNQNTSASDATPKVTGIGGIFFQSDNPAETRAWYAKNLGLEFNDWGGCGFDSRNLDNPEKVDSLQWTLFKKDSDYFQPSKTPFMINYRVQHLEALLERLRANGVAIIGDVTSYDFGKFAHVLDADGNKIELWEPS